MALKSERPLRRSLIKMLISLFRGSEMAHAQDWWPGLSLDVPPDADRHGAIFYREKRIASLLHADVLKKRAGREIFIIGSGPSLPDSDLSRIGPCTSVLLNGAISLIADDIAEPLAIAIEDERFVWRHFDLMKKKIAAQTICLLSVSVIRAVCEIDSSWLADRSIVLIDDIRKPYNARRRSNAQLSALDFIVLSENGIAGFSEDPSKGVFQGGSVVVSALQFAASCRPAQIGFFGIDISNANVPRFYERAGQSAKSGIAGASARILAHIELAGQVCQTHGIALLNFSAVSALRQCGLPYDARYARGS